MLEADNGDATHSLEIHSPLLMVQFKKCQIVIVVQLLPDMLVAVSYSH